MRRKKRERLPNGYGSIVYLGKGRRRPYAVYEPVREYSDNFDKVTDPLGSDYRVRPKRKPICYTSTWDVGFAVLTLWRAGKYHPGMEIDLEAEELRYRMERYSGNADRDRLLQHLIRTYNASQNVASKLEAKVTFATVYKEWFEAKTSEKKLSDASIKNIVAAFRHSECLHEMGIEDIRGADIAKAIDSNDCPSTINRQKQVIKAVFRFALAQDYIQKDYAELSLADRRDTYKPAPSERITNEEIGILWDHADDEDCAFTLIMIFSGGRAEEYRNFEVDWKEMCFRGGLKTESGRNRIIPIHSAIIPLVKERLEKHKCLTPLSYMGWRHRFNAMKERYGLNPSLTLHDTRSTFTSMAIAAGISTDIVDILVGHKSKSLTIGTYTHLTCEELRREIEKIKKYPV